MGLNGAFLTGDIFNLFVFFEVLLIASYGLMLSGGRGERMRAGPALRGLQHRASTLFLIALGLVYGLLGSLNMAELAVRVAAIARAGTWRWCRPRLACCWWCSAPRPRCCRCTSGCRRPTPTRRRRWPALFVIMTKVGALRRAAGGHAELRRAGRPLDGFAWPALLALGGGHAGAGVAGRAGRVAAARAGRVPGAGVGGDAVRRLRAGHRRHDRRRPLLPGAQQFRRRRPVPARRPDPPSPRPRRATART